MDGQPTGKFEEADLAVASWYQHTSRDGDPHLHMHNQILHTARTRSDGKWRAPANEGYVYHARAAAEVFAAHFEAALTRRFGFEWVPRADGLGYEIKGVRQEVMDAFSSRRNEIEAYLSGTLIPDFVKAHGREPSQAEAGGAGPPGGTRHPAGEARGRDRLGGHAGEVGCQAGRVARAWILRRSRVT